MENKTIETAKISQNQFETILEKQNISVVWYWTRLTEGKIYEIIGFRTINTKNGESTIITLSDNSEVWAPSALSNRLEWLDKNQLPFFVRPTGKKKSESTGYLYWDFDFIVSE